MKARIFSRTVRSPSSQNAGQAPAREAARLKRVAPPGAAEAFDAGAGSMSGEIPQRVAGVLREARSRPRDYAGLLSSQQFHAPGVRMGANVMVLS